MASEQKAVLITSSHGRVLAAQFPIAGEGHSKEEPPTGRLVALDGQNMISVSIPREAMELSGPDLHRYFSEVKIGSDGRVELPNIKIEKMHQK